MKISFSRHLNHEIWLDIETEPNASLHISIIGWVKEIVEELGLLDKVFIEEEK